MFARSVTVRLKPNARGEFNSTFQNEILPILQQQKGFRDALTLVSVNGSQAIGISLWEQKQDSENYPRLSLQNRPSIITPKPANGTTLGTR